MKKAKRAFPRGVGVWLFGGIIAMLALLDLSAWATLWNVPNPLSALFVASKQAEPAPLQSTAFAAPIIRLTPAE